MNSTWQAIINLTLSSTHGDFPFRNNALFLQKVFVQTHQSTVLFVNKIQLFFGGVLNHQ
jgi:hypothetical protein